MPTERETSKLDDIKAKTSEHFTDFLILARTSDGEVSWRASNPLWADAAARRYVDYCHTNTKLMQIETFHNGRDDG